MTIPRNQRSIVKFFRITFTVGEDSYTVMPLPPAPHRGQTAFRLRKQNGDQHVHDVRLTDHGPRCDCRGFQYRHRCKHIAMLRAARMLNGGNCRA